MEYVPGRDYVAVELMPYNPATDSPTIQTCGEFLFGGGTGGGMGGGMGGRIGGGMGGGSMSPFLQWSWEFVPGQEFACMTLLPDNPATQSPTKQLLGGPTAKVDVKHPFKKDAAKDPVLILSAGIDNNTLTINARRKARRSSLKQRTRILRPAPVVVGAFEGLNRRYKDTDSLQVAVRWKDKNGKVVGYATNAQPQGLRDKGRTDWEIGGTEGNQSASSSHRGCPTEPRMRTLSWCILIPSSKRWEMPKAVIFPLSSAPFPQPSRRRMGDEGQS